MAVPWSDEGSTLVLRLSVTRAGEVRIRLIAVTLGSPERVLGTVTSSAAAAALVRGWIDTAIDSVSRPDPAPDR